MGESRSESERVRKREREREREVAPVTVLPCGPQKVRDEGRKGGMEGEGGRAVTEAKRELRRNEGEKKLGETPSYIQEIQQNVPAKCA